MTKTLSFIITIAVNRDSLELSPHHFLPPQPPIQLFTNPEMPAFFSCDCSLWLILGSCTWLAAKS